MQTLKQRPLFFLEAVAGHIDKAVGKHITCTLIDEHMEDFSRTPPACSPARVRIALQATLWRVAPESATRLLPSRRLTPALAARAMLRAVMLPDKKGRVQCAFAKSKNHWQRCAVHPIIIRAAFDHFMMMLCGVDPRNEIILTEMKLSAAKIALAIGTETEPRLNAKTAWGIITSQPENLIVISDHLKGVPEASRMLQIESIFQAIRKETEPPNAARLAEILQSLPVISGSSIGQA